MFFLFWKMFALASWQLHIHLATFPSWDSPGSQMSHPKMVSRCSVWNGSEIRHDFWTAGVSQVISVLSPSWFYSWPEPYSSSPFGSLHQNDDRREIAADSRFVLRPRLALPRASFPTSCGGEPKIRVAEPAASWVRAGGIILVEAWGLPS